MLNLISKSINEISISGSKPVILVPLLVVILINGIKIFLEDLKRKASDDEENNKTSFYFNNQTNKFQEIKWKNITLGMIIKIKENDQFPADLVLLKSSDKNGICYVETKNLDGETNLKLKKNHNVISKYFDEEKNISSCNGILFCNPPDDNIHQFSAHFKINFDEKAMTEKKIKNLGKIFFSTSLIKKVF